MIIPLTIIVLSRIERRDDEQCVGTANDVGGKCHAFIAFGFAHGEGSNTAEIALRIGKRQATKKKIEEKWREEITSWTHKRRETSGTGRHSGIAPRGVRLRGGTSGTPLWIDDTRHQHGQRPNRSDLRRHTLSQHRRCRHREDVLRTGEQNVMTASSKLKVNTRDKLKYGPGV